MRLYASDHCLLLPQDHSFLVALRHMKTPDMDFFFQNKAALDDDGLFHHRKNCRIAFLSNGRHGIDLTANRYSIDLHPFMVQRFIDKLSSSRVTVLTCTISPAICRFDTVRSSAYSGKSCFPYWQFRRHGKPRHELKSDSLHPISEWTVYTKKPAAPDDLT